MVAFLRMLAPDNSDNNAFRAWGGQLSADLTAMGILKTTDSGQINWATAVTPGGNGVVGGYEIRRFNDALQATAPVFFKIEYAGGRTTDSPGLYLTVGTGSDGSGKLTGVVSARLAPSVYNAGSSSLHRCAFSGDTNRVAIAMFITKDPDSFFFSIERTKDSAGNDTNEGILFSSLSWDRTNGSGGGRLRFTQFLPFSGSLPAGHDSGIFMPTGYRNGSIGYDFCLYPNYMFNQGKLLNPGITHLGYFNQNKDANTFGTVTIYGKNRNYYFLGDYGSHINFISRGGLDSTAIAMLYE